MGIYLKTFTYLWYYLALCFLECEIFQTKFVEKIKTHILCQINFFLIRAVCEIIWKNIVEPDKAQTVENMRIASCIPKATNAHSECVIRTYSFSTATMVTRTLLDVRLHVHCLCLLFMKRNESRKMVIYTYTFVIINQSDVATKVHKSEIKKLKVKQRMQYFWKMLRLDVT